MKTAPLGLMIAALMLLASPAESMPSPTLWSGPTTVVAVGGSPKLDLCQSGNVEPSYYGDSISCLCDCYNRGYDWYTLQYTASSTYDSVCSCGGGQLTQPAATAYI